MLVITPIYQAQFLGKLENESSVILGLYLCRILQDTFENPVSLEENTVVTLGGIEDVEEVGVILEISQSFLDLSFIQIELHSDEVVCLLKVSLATRCRLLEIISYTSVNLKLAKVHEDLLDVIILRHWIIYYNDVAAGASKARINIRLLINVMLVGVYVVLGVGVLMEVF